MLLYHGPSHILVVGPPKLTFQVNCPVPKILTLGYLKGQLLAPQVIQYTLPGLDVLVGLYGPTQPGLDVLVGLYGPNTTRAGRPIWVVWAQHNQGWTS